MQTIELLSPARNVQVAREAILHGADAVYIGAPRYGARAAAGNSVEDIRELVEFAHIFRVRVYVTLNTILFENELEDARRLVIQLYEAGVDALIVQDMAFLEMELPPIPLHASTQMDNRDADKVRLLGKAGFEQAVLARELSIDEIRDIHSAVPDMKLEVFVHGATCVSYNGKCYASQYCFGRSANRGECAQFCRLPLDLIDSDGRIVSDANTGMPVRQRHLLSLHDMNRSEDVEALMDAGVVSFKIEGRLKDDVYVKNVTAYYRRCIDRVISRRPGDFQRASIGESAITFTPQLDRSFNRGFSDYFMHGRSHDMVQLFSPKSVGQPVGHVKEVRRNCFTVSTTVPFSNGDGICFVDANGELQGVRVNRVDGNCLYPKEMPRGMKPRMVVYRNFDKDFVQKLSKPTAQRRISVSWRVEDVTGGSCDPMQVTLRLTLLVDEQICVCQEFAGQYEEARTPQRDNVARQLSRLGDTPFVAERVDVAWSREWFIPSSVLADYRREMVDLLMQKLTETNRQAVAAGNKMERRFGKDVPKAYFANQSLSYSGNVSNSLAKKWYLQHGAVAVEPAMEAGGEGDVLMTMRYCPRYELGLCGSNTGPLYLRGCDGRVFPLSFDCRHCLVRVMAPSK